MTAKTKVFRIEIELNDVWPTVRRTVEVPGETSLAVVHEIVQTAMGWENAHLHEFEVAGTRYGVPDPDEDAGLGDETRAVLSRLATADDRLGYVYDFGDSWEHTLSVEAVDAPEPGVRYPRCIAGERACPPEDVGGAPGYEQFLEAIADPTHPEHDDHLEWLGGSQFDPARFDLDATDQALVRLAWKPLPAPTAQS
jgi:hypothetical protein